MKITVIIDYEGGKEHVAVQERHFDKELAEDLNGGIQWIGEVIRNGIVGYLSACEEWTMKSEVEKMLLITHDLEKGYAGKAPAGKPEAAWDTKLLSAGRGMVCVSVGGRDGYVGI